MAVFKDFAAPFTLGIDASNLRAGGGLTHLVEVLRAAQPADSGFDRVIVWASQATLVRLQDRPWLGKRTDPVLESHYLRRALWQRYELGKRANAEGCHLIFAPGGAFATAFRPIVIMSRNLLPFEWRELARYGVSAMSFRLMALRWLQSRSFRRATGTIFLTRYAQQAVMKVTGSLSGQIAMIPHGLDHRFLQVPRLPRSLAEYSSDRPFRLVYVSIVNLYKHQWCVAEAVAGLRNEGFPVVLELIGPAYPPALALLRKTLQHIDPMGQFINYAGPIAYADLHIRYAQADVCVFASSCENMPNILLEGMASGLPIACSNRGPMPEVLGDAGVYFDPECPSDIARALRELMVSVELRAGLSRASFERVQAYTWQRCAKETFRFLSDIAGAYSST